MESREKAAAHEEKSRNQKAAEGAPAAEAIEEGGEKLRSGVVGGLKAGHEIESEVVGLVSSTLADTVRATGAVVTETVDVARTVLTGTVQATEEVGVSLAGAVNGAIDVAGNVGTHAVAAVRDILVGTVTGVKDVLGAALPQSSRRESASGSPHPA